MKPYSFVIFQAGWWGSDLLGPCNELVLEVSVCMLK